MKWKTKVVRNVLGLLLFLGHNTFVSAENLLTQRLHAIRDSLPQSISNLDQDTSCYKIEFREQRFSAVLVRPLILEGHITYDLSVQKLEKTITSPTLIDMTIEKDAVVVEMVKDTRNESVRITRRYSLRAQPVLLATVSSLRGLLEADVNAIEQYFLAEYETEGDEWRLILTPRDEQIAQTMISLTIFGQNSKIQGITTRMTNGDRQHMTFLLPSTC